MDPIEINSSQEIVPAFESSNCDDHAETCRLRDALNDHCLLHIMSYLSVTDILQMCKMDSYFRDLAERCDVISNKLVNVISVPEATRNEIFYVFGKTMKKVMIREVDMPDLLKYIVTQPNTVTNFVPRKLTELYLKSVNSLLTTDTRCDSYVVQLTETIHILSELRKFTINALYSRITGRYDIFMGRLLHTTSNLSVLKLLNMNVEGHWLTEHGSLNLTELSIENPIYIRSEELTHFIKRLPKLRKFYYCGDEDIVLVALQALQKYCPNLDKFYNIHKGEGYLYTLDQGRTLNGLISSFDNLTGVGLTSYTLCGCDLYEMLMVLRAKKIRQLKVYSDLRNARKFDQGKRQYLLENCCFSDFLSLVEFELELRYDNGPKRPDDCNFLLLFGSQLKNLRKFIMNANYLTNLDAIFKSFSQIVVLSIAKTEFLHLPLTMRHLIRLLRKLRQEGNQTHLMKLIIDIKQFRELTYYKDLYQLTNVAVQLKRKQ